MRSTKAIVADAVAALATAGAAVAASLGGADVATGHGTAVACPEGPPPPLGLRTCAFATREFTFAAASSPQADHAGGMYRATDVLGRYVRGRVTCITAVGNMAVIGGTVEERVLLPTDMVPPGADRFAVWVVDNDVVAESDVPDLHSPFFNYTEAQFGEQNGQCLLPPVSPGGYLTVVEGDIRVRDGQLAGPAS